MIDYMNTQDYVKDSNMAENIIRVSCFINVVNNTNEL